MRNFFWAFLCLIFLAEVSRAQPVAPPLPKYMSLPNLPVSRSQLGPITRPFYESGVSNTVGMWKQLDSKSACPRTNQFIKHIYDRIISANNLDSYFRLENIKMNLVVLCPNGFGEDAFAATGILVISAAFIKTFMLTEDEVAYMLSHELSHIIRAWDMRTLLNPLSKQLSVIKREEDEADENAIVMLANAGYDPHSAFAYQIKYAQSLPEEEAFFEPTHTAPILRPAMARLNISKHQLQKKSATLFSNHVREIFRSEVGLQ